MSSFRPFARHLTLNGAGVTHRIIADYSLGNGPVNFELVPAAGEILLVRRLIYHAHGTGGFDEFNVLPALTVGLVLSASSFVWGSTDVRYDGGEGLTVPTGANLTTDDEIQRICYDLAQKTLGAGGGARNTSAARYSFDRFAGDPTQDISDGGILLEAGGADYVRIVAHDDFSPAAFEDHTWLAEGAIIQQAGGFALG